MKLLLVSSVLGVASAFAPLSQQSMQRSALRSTEPDESAAESETLYSVLSDDEPNPDFENAYDQSSAVAVPTINGWMADETKPCYGLPGAVAPTGYFDPIGFSQSGISLNDVKRYRESEVMHGRVAMLAAVGFLAGEAIPGPFTITGPANDQLQQMPAPAFAFLTVFIAAIELKRATTGWVEPSYEPGSRTLWTLRDNYYPGDIGFDPLGLKPTDPKEFANMQTKELQNGRLAMLGVAGMCAQELVNHKTIMATIEFYEKVYSGVNPYE